MKTCLHLFVCFIAIASAACAFGADDANELALLMFNRTEIETEVRENYRKSFGEFLKTEQINQVVNKYLQSEFAWAELQTLVVAAIRSSFTPEEQKQILSFMKSPAGVKYRAVGKSPSWKSFDDLLERENQKLFAAIESAVGQKKQ